MCESLPCFCCLQGTHLYYPQRDSNTTQPSLHQTCQVCFSLTNLSSFFHSFTLTSWCIAVHALSQILLHIASPQSILFQDRSRPSVDSPRSDPAVRPREKDYSAIQSFLEEGRGEDGNWEASFKSGMSDSKAEDSQEQYLELVEI